MGNILRKQRTNRGAGSEKVDGSGRESGIGMNGSGRVNNKE